MKNDELIRCKVKNFYDIQRLRIQAGGRIKKTADEVQLNKKDKEFFEAQEGLFKKLEKNALKAVKSAIKDHVMVEWLYEIKGIAETSAGVLLSEFDINKADTVSKFWAFSGLHVVDGKAPKPTKGQKLSYNSWLRSKLVGVIADNFIRAQNEYTSFYYNYKQRKESQGWGGYKDKDGKLKSVDGHRHNAAKRYMIKMFLKDFWVKWREVEGLPVRPSYQEEYLGHKHAV